jgi:alcohol dehydrogenase
MLRPGGRLASIGVHGKPATLHLEDLWIRDITITTGLVDVLDTHAAANAGGRAAGRSA